MKLHFLRVKRAFSAFADWAILSPRITFRPYNRFLFNDDKTGKPIIDHPSFDDVEHYQVMVPTVSKLLPLNAHFFKHPTSANVLLFNIGRSGDIQQKFRHTRLFLNVGISVLVFEYRGFGATPGLPSPRSICEDGVAAYDYLVNKLNYPPEQIIIFGESLGGSVAAHTSSLRPSSALILQSTFVSLDEISDTVALLNAPKALLPLLKLVLPKLPVPNPALDNLAIVTQPHPPLLILHGALDSLIPVADAELLYRDANETDSKTLVVLPNSKHSDLGMAQTDIPLFLEVVTEFLASL